MDVLLAPDVFVNASVALGSPPDKVVQRVLGGKNGKAATTPWILERVAAMLSAVPEFKKEAVDKQVELIKSLVDVLEVAGEHAAEDWRGALLAAAKEATARRVITDHPDLLEEDDAAVEFISTEAWLLEQAMPPPPPGS